MFRLLHTSVLMRLGWAGQNPGKPATRCLRQLVKRREVREISESCWKGPSESCQHSSGTFAGIASTTGCVSLQENHGQDGHLHTAQLQGCSDRRCHRSEQGTTVVLQVFDRQRHTHKHVNTHTTDTTDTTDTRHTHTHQKITTHTHTHPSACIAAGRPCRSLCKGPWLESFSHCLQSGCAVFLHDLAAESGSGRDCWVFGALEC